MRALWGFRGYPDLDLDLDLDISILLVAVYLYIDIISSSPERFRTFVFQNGARVIMIENTNHSKLNRSALLR